jgi:Holliday junction DNA helicase RuvA
VLELKDKVGVAAAWEAASGKQAEGTAEMNDAVLALISLGYKQVDAHKAVKQVLEVEPGRKTAEEIVRKALKTLV